MATAAAFLNEEAIERRAQALTLIDPYRISTAPPDQLLRWQSMLGYGDAWGAWNVPPEWMPSGAGQRPSSRAISLTQLLPDNVDGASDAAVAMWAELLRFGLLRSLVPARRGGIATPATVAGELHLAKRLARAHLSAVPMATSLWVSVRDAAATEALKPSGWKILRSALWHLYQTGYLPELELTTRRVVGQVQEADRQGAALVAALSARSEPWQALPDRFVAECGWRVLWLMKQVGPTIVGTLERIATQDMPDEGARNRESDNALARRRAKHRNALVAGVEWRGLDGGLIAELPVARRHAVWRGSRSAEMQNEGMLFPPKRYADLLLLAGMLQSCHAFILLLSAAPRSSSVMSYTESCVDETPGQSPRIVGNTYKKRQEHVGRKRDFPAPKIVLQTARQQIKLARAVKAIARRDGEVDLGDHIWVHISNTGPSRQGQPLYTLNDRLDALVRFLGLEDLLGVDESCHPHRFRKTLGRLVALALVNAQMILMDCFGHDDPEVTLTSYILSDRTIHADVLRVQKELVILLASEAIESADELGGRGGEVVRDARTAMLKRLGKDALDPQDVAELASALTLEGRTWTTVGPGIICALPLGMTGPCAKRQGARNVANCRSGCDHQLLTQYNKTETDDTIAFLVDQLEAAITEENELMAAQWRSQLRNWLYRWREVFDKWADHPLLSSWVAPWASEAART